MTKRFPGRLQKKWNMPLRKSTRQLFLGEGTEPLTNELIEELVLKGWKKSDLLYHRQRGGMYSRPRNTVFYPPEHGTMERD